VSIRARLAILVSAVAILLGVGAVAQAAPLGSNTTNNGCVVVPSAKLAVCLERF
jgi:hypothetical protein